MKRWAFAVLAWVACAAPALALERGDLIGAWDSQWADAANEPISGGGPLTIRLDDSADALDGVTAAPGFDGVMNGEIETRADGSVIWSGRWASVWRDTVERGTFRFVFTSADAFAGTWSTDDGRIQNAAWNGGRAR